MQDLAKAILKKHEGRLLKAGGSWIFDNEIARVEGSLLNGGLIRVEDHDGFPLGTGYYNRNSKIRIRMLTRDPERTVDAAFLKARIRDAWAYRKKVVDTSSCRVIFGESDLLPGLTVDKYGDVLVIEALTLYMDRMKEALAELLVEVLKEDGIAVRGIYERNDSKERLKEGLEKTKGFLGEPFDTLVPMTENGVRYLVDVAEGQKTGFFLDQKYNRLAIRPFAAGADVLDCFTHTGAFALNAAAAGARSVTAVDASESALASAARNAALNGFTDIRFEREDIPEWLPTLTEAGRRFGLVILDPPAFAKAAANRKNALRAYESLNRDGMLLVEPGGYLATCTCSHFISAQDFEEMLIRASRRAHRRLRRVEWRAQAPDHPVLETAPGSSYLKFGIFQVLPVD